MSEEMLYKKTGIKSKVIQEIIELAKKNHVDKVILFGSRARGDYKERSNIDLAFLEVREIILFWMWMKRHQLFLNLML